MNFESHFLDKAVNLLRDCPYDSSEFKGFKKYFSDANFISLDFSTHRKKIYNNYVTIIKLLEFCKSIKAFSISLDSLESADYEEKEKDKIKTIATKIYGADDVEYSSVAKRNLRTIANLGLEGLPVCIAKTQKSLSDNPALLGRPKGFTITVREIEIAAGAGFLVPITGDMMRMPGLPAHPASENISIDNDGNISGLF